jgi:molybdopterin synthase catalytic subunit/molybdopterin synthase sulfur carrier subunit
MQLEVLLFAAAREAADSDSIRISVDAPARAGDVIDAIGRELPQLLPLLPACRLAIDCSYVTPDDVVDKDCGEIALIPPVSGG